MLKNDLVKLFATVAAILAPSRESRYFLLISVMRFNPLRRYGDCDPSVGYDEKQENISAFGELG